MRTRGLKLEQAGYIKTIRGSRSYADARIETIMVSAASKEEASRSYADARIETLSHCETLSIVSIAFLCGRAD